MSEHVGNAERDDAALDQFVGDHFGGRPVPAEHVRRSAMLAPRTERPAPTPPVRDEAAESEDRQINQFLASIGHPRP